ncbi:MAG: riboflavin synthase [Desulfovibrio sp.]|nr:riboflavin synthase [Desulfovibrio sp.]
MFTGIVHGLGEIAAVRKSGEECRLVLRPRFALKDIRDGESVAVNGVCLTVEEHDEDTFTVYASRETVTHTVIGEFSPGRQVNLERALAVGDRLGGHIVSGHVDCLALVQKLRPEGLSLLCQLGFPKQFGPEVIPKGSVALDGVSLTVNNCGEDFLTVNVIPDTRKRTTVSFWRVGNRVHMETDILGKYVRRQLGRRDSPENVLNREFLLENGFL